jgi:hypothetical protein
LKIYHLSTVWCFQNLLRVRTLLRTAGTPSGSSTATRPWRIPTPPSAASRKKSGNEVFVAIPHFSDRTFSSKLFYIF